MHYAAQISFATMAIGVVFLPFSHAQPPAQKPAFEVASIKRNTSGGNGVMSRVVPGGRWVINNATLELLIGMAYSTRDLQIAGGPKWTSTDRWDIEAKAEEGSVPAGIGAPSPLVPDHPLYLMLQSLLEDRFRLKVHRETKEVPVFELVVSKTGPRMKLSVDQDSAESDVPGADGRPARGFMRLNRGIVEGKAVRVEFLAQILSDSRIAGRIVNDKTALKGLYDFKLEWRPDLDQWPSPPGVSEPSLQTTNLSGPSLFTALEEQLGLKLESAKGPVEVLVIDSVQKPSEN